MGYTAGACLSMADLLARYWEQIVGTEKTFVIIKPDAISRGLIGEIISRFERKGLMIETISWRHKNTDWCMEHYCHLPPKIYEEMERYVTGTPLVGVVLMGKDAVRVVRQMVGCTDSLDAAPGTIRGDYGSYPIKYNLVHAADTPVNAEHEIKLFSDGRTDCE